MPESRINRLPERMSGFPTPVAGLALGIAGLGLAWDSRLPGTPLVEFSAVIAAALLTLLTVRFLLHPATLARDLANPVLGGVAPRYAMGWMLVSISANFAGTAILREDTQR